MMPGTIAERHAEAVTVEAATRTEVRNLTGAERTVALYASDMPNGRRHHTSEQYAAWIVQGAERLGRTEMRRLALYLRGWQVLNVNDLMTEQIQTRHELRFPQRHRLVRAGQGSGLSVYVDGMTKVALARNGKVALDGDCPCEGTGGIMLWGNDPDASGEIMCPVHCRAEINAYRRALLAAR
ncbi:hypothetical protein RM863_23240 [Streptomyces sp. DSM 41014]|uniref:Uncharacterized protein n=1 Tax=Streptomyces hintoniae TaxID=3075521 RepID=A0ABU2UPQ5_9ACTN|nr:hypothetical protein [Streptomyces sp. DSM 41014]MDT0475044.1 hypothetical protein [Streptomyces sp. DSM 41014]